MKGFRWCLMSLLLTVLTFSGDLVIFFTLVFTFYTMCTVHTMSIINDNKKIFNVWITDE